VAQIKSSSNITEIPTNEEKIRYIQLFLQDTQQVVNGRLDLATNTNSPVVSQAFSAANTDTTVNHNLGRAPRGYLVVGRTAAMIIYDGTVASNATTITLKSSAVGTARFIFL